MPTNGTGNAPGYKPWNPIDLIRLIVEAIMEIVRAARRLPDILQYGVYLSALIFLAALAQFAIPLPTWAHVAIFISSSSEASILGIVCVIVHFILEKERNTQQKDQTAELVSLYSNPPQPVPAE